MQYSWLSSLNMIHLNIGCYSVDVAKCFLCLRNSAGRAACPIDMVVNGFLNLRRLLIRVFWKTINMALYKYRRKKPRLFPGGFKNVLKGANFQFTNLRRFVDTHPPPPLKVSTWLTPNEAWNLLHKNSNLGPTLHTHTHTPLYSASIWSRKFEVNWRFSAI